MFLNILGGAVAATLATGPATPSAVRWSISPHRAVAAFAESRLTPAAASEARRLLHGATLADVSNWADEIRPQRPATAIWHYVNIPLADSTYRPQQHCPRGCIVRAYAQQLLILRDRTRSDAARADALRFLVHLVADVHSPMHAGDRGDRGGNDLVVWHRGRRTNLHAFWDSGLLRAGGLDERDLLQRMETTAAAHPDSRALSGGTVVEWALESQREAREVAYRLLPGDLRLGQDYVDRALPVLHDRLLRAGFRLAAVLNHALAQAPRPGG